MLASPAKPPRCSALPPPCRSLDAGLDGAWVRGLRLSVPFACQGSNGSSSSSSGAGSGAAGDCQPAAAVNLTVYVGDLPPPQQLAASEPGSSLCATGVAALGGQPLAIDCGRFMQGEHAVPTGLEYSLQRARYVHQFAALNGGLGCAGGQAGKRAEL